ncbi:MAG: nicotinate phosphoribosyltransferase [Treponemataceae bacterium]
MSISSALFTDFYELTMAQGFWKKSLNVPSVFDMFFRRQPFNGGFSILCGTEPFFEILENFHFSQEDLTFLENQKVFEKDFLYFLENFRFTGDIFAMEEGSVIFPNEPLLRIHANLIEAQILEGILLNQVNFQSLIATKTARVWLASQKGHIMEFGLRRAQGSDGAMSASRASFIGGASSTSNSLSGKEFGIPIQGTMAHSWIMSFDSELEAFQSYAEIYPNDSTFLIDTYDTLKSGIVNAIEVGKSLNEKKSRFGVRLDSGDIQYLSTQVRKKLDLANCTDAFIAVSNELDEEIIETLIQQKAPIDSWGVGTHLVTGGSDSSFTGVYKLASRMSKDGQFISTMKFSENPEKTTNPGIKNVWRLYDQEGMAKADILALEDEELQAGVESTFYHPSIDYRQFDYTPLKTEKLLNKKVENGKRLQKLPIQEQILQSRNHMKNQIELFDASYKRLLNPHIYKVSITSELKKLKLSFIEKFVER